MYSVYVFLFFLNCIQQWDEEKATTKGAGRLGGGWTGVECYKRSTGTAQTEKKHSTDIPGSQALGKRIGNFVFHWCNGLPSISIRGAGRLLEKRHVLTHRSSLNRSRQGLIEVFWPFHSALTVLPRTRDEPMSLMMTQESKGNRRKTSAPFIFTL